MNKIQNANVLCVEEIFKDKYVIPLYQRNFAWGEEQISRLLQDIYESMISGDEHFYIGSLIVLQRENGEFEVIDGQQRLTMLSILSGILVMGIHLNLRYDSRPEVEDFFRILNRGEIPTNRKECSISHFFDAIDIIKSTQLDVKKLEEINIRSNSTIRLQMANYIKQHVCLVREIMPNDTDVAAYFEIMNNRGEQLQEHEIIKGLLLGKLHEDGNDIYSTICSKIWDACSQMGIRIQKSFSPKTRRILFGDNCDSLKLNGVSNEVDYGINNKPILDELKDHSKYLGALSIEEIIDSNITIEPEKDSEDDNERNPKEESIIDFPNFLMHIFKLYYNQTYSSSSPNKETEIPLNEKYLLKVYNIIRKDINPLDFFLRLLYCRVIFDRYIIKSNVTDDDDKREWVLLKPSIYEDKNKGTKTLRFKQTFGDNENNAIVRSISCLQVSFRTKTYKNFLQSILKWFVNEGLNIEADSYLKKLHCLMLSEFETSSKYLGIKDFEPNMQGTHVPHYLFNFTDYLYWWMKYSKYDIEQINTSKEQLYAIRGELDLINKSDFRFLYRNSIEHHYPQKRREEYEAEGISDFDLNCLGNLVLISKSVNSRLSDKNPIDKAALYIEKTDLPPTRQIIYNITRNNNRWGKDEISTHLNCMEIILKNRESIMNCIMPIALKQ